MPRRPLTCSRAATVGPCSIPSSPILACIATRVNGRWCWRGPCPMGIWTTRERRARRCWHKSTRHGRNRACAVVTASPLRTWNADLGTAAQGHSQAMANDNYFAHQDPNGDMPWDRAKAAGYGGRQIGENIAAGQRSPGKAMEGWLASPGHCANLMSPMFTQVGAASAANSRSDNGVYWTMLFGAK